MSDAAPGRSFGRRRSIFDWKAVLGIIVSLGLLYFAFRGVDLAEVARHLGRANPWWLALAGATATAVFPLRAIRWGPLLRPVEHTRFRPRFVATNIGFMANNLLPARVGEFARAYAVGRMSTISASAAFGSLVVERLFDGLTIVSFLVIALLWPTFPETSAGGRDFGAVAVTASAVIVGLGLAILAFALWPDRVVRFVGRIAHLALPRAAARRVTSVIESVIAGLYVLRQPRLLLPVIAWSAAVWLCSSLAFYFGFLAFGIDVPFIGALFLNSVIALAVALPSAPGFFGLFEAGARVGLVDVWGIDATAAVAYAVGFHLAGFIPITLMGLYDAWRLGLSIHEVEHSEELVESESDDAG